MNDRDSVFCIKKSMDRDTQIVGWFHTKVEAREYYLEHVSTMMETWQIEEHIWLPIRIGDDWNTTISPVQVVKISPVDDEDSEWLEYQRLSKKFGRLPKPVNAN